MFPLGSVLFPHMPLALRLFEQRYLVMLGRLLESEQPSLGVVLIERGHEVGGGDQRFDVGTMARIVSVSAHQDHMAVVAVGTDRFRVREWLPDDPFPQAEVELLPGLQWREDLQPELDRTSTEVRRALAAASEFTEQQWPADVQIDEDPVAACWQLAGLAPVGSLDQVSLLRSESTPELLAATARMATEAVETLSLGWGGDPGL
jgi:Lon protease-like protein